MKPQQSVDNTALYIGNNIKAPTNIGETFQEHLRTKCRAKLDGNTEGRIKFINKFIIKNKACTLQ